jgi:hypothetical protein
LREIGLGKLDREQAEKLTETIGRGIENYHALAMALVDRGASRFTVMGILAQTEQQAVDAHPEVFGDPEIRAAAHALLVEPVVRALSGRGAS